MVKKKTPKNYFGEDQEQAVFRFLQSESDVERNKIFNEYLRTPLIIMVESIIRRYKLYRKDYTYDESHTDTMSFLMTKIDKFDKDKNTKAYSYFGTICKNYLMGAIQKTTKESNRNVSYEDVSSDVEEKPIFSYVIDEEIIDYGGIITKLSSELEIFIENEEMTENERKLGYALIEIFNNYNEIFQIGGSNKFNKNLILLSLRDMTSLSTKDIRLSIKRYKKIYNGILENVIK